jgi:branched-subunit amino acid ABC-type transport system permease component
MDPVWKPYGWGRAVELLKNIFLTPFADMVGAPDFLLQVIWEGLVSGILYALIALGFALIFRASRIFNFAQGIMVVFAALTLVGLHALGLPAWVAFAGTLVVMFLLAVAIERVGRAIRALGDDHQAALSVGISLTTICVLVWFLAGIIALMTGIAWGSRAGVSFGLEVIALKALPVLMLGGLESITGAIVGGLMIGVLEKPFEIHWGQPLPGGSTEAWFAYVLALVVLLLRPQGLFGGKIIERV